MDDFSDREHSRTIPSTLSNGLSKQITLVRSKLSLSLIFWLANIRGNQVTKTIYLFHLYFRISLSFLAREYLLC